MGGGPETEIPVGRALHTYSFVEPYTEVVYIPYATALEMLSTHFQKYTKTFIGFIEIFAPADVVLLELPLQLLCQNHSLDQERIRTGG